MIIDDYTPQERLSKIADILAEGVLCLLNDPITFIRIVNISDKVLVEDFVVIRLSDLTLPKVKIHYLS